MRIISVINQKGGVGKTTTTANLAHALAMKGYKVTAIDLDPQSHLGTSFGVSSRDYAGMDEVLMEGGAVEDYLIEVRDNLNLIPAGAGLGQIEHLSGEGAKRGMHLRRALEGKLQDQDYILIDCPPASGLLAVNALLASKEVLVPVVGDYLSLDGLSFLMATFKNFEQKLGHSFKQWIVLTRFHTRRRLPKEILEKLINYFPGKVFTTRIREAAAIAECPSFGKTIFEYRSKSNGALDYTSLADDMINSRTIQ